MKIDFKTRAVGACDVFYREAGPVDGTVILLLHGFPTASHMFRDLMPLLAAEYRVIAPDLPGFGNTRAPGRASFEYTFDHLAEVIHEFTMALGLDRFALYVFDYGAPVGYRIAAAHPDKILAIVSQNGNAYREGLSANWGPWEAYWHEPTAAHRDACSDSFTVEFIRDGQYLHGSPAGSVSPDGYTLDLAYLARPGAREVQLDLILDYRTNLERYPSFHAYFLQHQPPFLATWGRHDEAFLPMGAEAYRRHLPGAEIHLLDAGHFALESHAAEIAVLMLDFLERKLP